MVTIIILIRTKEIYNQRLLPIRNILMLTGAVQYPISKTIHNIHKRVFRVSIFNRTKFNFLQIKTIRNLKWIKFNKKYYSNLINIKLLTIKIIIKLNIDSRCIKRRFNIRTFSLMKNDNLDFNNFRNIDLNFSHFRKFSKIKTYNLKWQFRMKIKSIKNNWLLKKILTKNIFSAARQIIMPRLWLLNKIIWYLINVIWKQMIKKKNKKRKVRKK